MRNRVKIWQTEDQIIAEIDRTHRKVEHIAAVLEALRTESSSLAGELEKVRFQMMQSDLSKQDLFKLERAELSTEKAFAKCKAESYKNSKTYARLVNKTLPRLKDILAAMRTQTMPEVMGGYRGVAIK